MGKTGAGIVIVWRPTTAPRCMRSSQSSRSSGWALSSGQRPIIGRSLRTSPRWKLRRQIPINRYAQIAPALIKEWGPAVFERT